MIFPKISVILLVAFATLCACLEEETPQGKRVPRRALPSVSRDHYSEVLSDGTYKYAYTGEHRYVAERRLADGTVEGESLFVRPDGVPVKVHYFADKEGYRPKTEVLYNERLVSTRTRTVPTHVREVVVPSVREVIVPGPAPAPQVVLAPPSTGENSVNVNFGGDSTGFGFRSSSYGGQGADININTNGGDVAAASPSVTAIVGPGGRAIIRPESHARTSGSSKYFRSSGGSSGDVAIANPHVNAIVGVGGSVIVEPKATAYVGGGAPEVVREVHHTQSVVRTPPEIQRYVEKVHVPVPVQTEHRGGYIYEAPRTVIQPPTVYQPASVLVRPPQAVAVHSSGVVLVPPSSKYSYSYGYSAPDPKHPQRDNSAYVNVQVNQ